MPNPIPEALRQILAEQYGDDDNQLNRILARVFLYGALGSFHPDGSRAVLPTAVMEVQVGPDNDGQFREIELETSADGWKRLLKQPPKQTEIAVYTGNFRQGAKAGRSIYL